MRKGTVVTEEQIRWNEIGADSRKAAQTAAAARLANGNPMTAEEIERRARNAQDREDIRNHCNGGNLSSCKNMSRAELIEEINNQLENGLYGNDRKAGLRALKRAYGVKGAETRLYELTGKHYTLKS